MKKAIDRSHNRVKQRAYIRKEDREINQQIVRNDLVTSVTNQEVIAKTQEQI